MKRIPYIFFSIILLFITSCSKIENEKITASKIKNVPFALEQYYKETPVNAGFTTPTEPDLYSTYWYSKIFNLYGKNIPNSGNIQKWLKSIEIEKKLQKNENGEIMANENVITNYALLLHEFKIDIGKDKAGDILDILENSNPNVKILNNGIKFNPTSIEVSKSLGVDIQHEKTAVSYLKKMIKQTNSDDEKIYYIYLLSLLSEKIDTDEIEKLNLSIQFQKSSKKMDIRVINNLYYLKLIDKFYKVPFDNSLSSKGLNELVNLYINNRTDITAQFLYKMLFLTKDPNEKDINQLTTFLTGIQLKNGWIYPPYVIDIISTNSGLIISNYYGSDINRNKISKYLNNVFISLNNDIDSNFLYLSPFISSIVNLDDKELGKKSKQFIQLSINKELEKSDPQLEILVELMKSSLLLKNQQDIVKSLDSQKISKLNEIFSTNINTGKTPQELLSLYYLSIQDNFLNQQDHKEYISNSLIGLYEKGQGFKGKQGIECNPYTTYIGLMTMENSGINLKDNDSLFNYLNKELKKETEVSSPDINIISQIILNLKTLKSV